MFEVFFSFDLFRSFFRGYKMIEEFVQGRQVIENYERLELTTHLTNRAGLSDNEMG